MMLNLIIPTLLSLLRTRGSLALENLALRQQLLVLERTNPKPAFNALDRLFWVVLSRVWSGWRLWWKWKSRPRDPGRPRIPYEVIELIKRISHENPTWGAPRIHGELLMLGYDLSEATVARYMIKRWGRPTQNWKTFLRNHLGETAAVDFLTMPTVMFQTLYVFVVLSLDRRHILHINVTRRPTAEWTAKQLYQAFPF